MVTTEYAPREITGKPSTDRVKKRYDELLNADIFLSSERCRLYTEYMKKHWFEPIYTRQGGALKHVFSNLTPVIRDGELIVGSMTPYIRGAHLYPEYEARWVRESLQGVKREEERYSNDVVAFEGESRIGIFSVTPEDREQIKKDIEFWERDWRQVAEEFIQEGEDWEANEKWHAQLVHFRFGWDAPEGRAIVSYRKAIDQGLRAIIERCQQKMKELRPVGTKENFPKYDFYKGTILTLEGVIAFANNYAREAEKLAQNADKERRKELLEIARICRKVPEQRADTFQEAAQSFWLIQLALHIEMDGRSISPGRFDQYMYRPFKDDIKAGRITKERALEILELLRIKHAEIERAHAKFSEAVLGGSNFQNITLGGTDAEGKLADNDLSILVLQAGINVRTPQPTLSIRWTDKLSEKFKLKAVECVKVGSGYPALFSDEVGLERFKSLGFPWKDVWDWAVCGCINMQVTGTRTPQWAHAPFSCLKLLELVVNDGVNPLTGDKLIDTGIKIDESSYEEIKQAWVRALGEVADKVTKFANIALAVHNELGLVMPLCSALLDDCIEKGLHCLDGGCRYNDAFYLTSTGAINVANSLAAIKKCVFDEKLFTVKELRNALSHDFEGYEDIRRHLLEAPKFGNGDDYVDDIAAEIYDSMAEEIAKCTNYFGLRYQTTALSVTTQVIVGNSCGATPDGRKKGDQICDGGVSAYPGTDVNGPTALLRSAARAHSKKMEGNLLNLKFHPAALEGSVGAKKFIALNDAYADLGGYHVQYNVVDSKMLRDAQEHPENYRDLMVRVAGFTARWIELGRSLQDEIIRRTEFQTM